MTPADLPERIAAKIVVAESGCWLWTAAKQDGGYGVVKWEGKGQPAHRVTYRLLVGPIPDGFEADHLCHVHDCVNPAHIHPISRAQNRARPRRVGVRTSWRNRERPPHRAGRKVSIGTYAAGCRCVECLDAWREYRAIRRGPLSSSPTSPNPVPTQQPTVIEAVRVAADTSAGAA